MVAHLVVTLIVLLPYISGKRGIDYHEFTGFSGFTKLISLAVCISIIVFARKEEEQQRELNALKEKEEGEKRRSEARARYENN